MSGSSLRVLRTMVGHCVRAARRVRGCRATPETSQGYWHWLFHLNQDLPELLVGANVDAYLRYFFERWTVQRHAAEEAVSHYVTAFSRPGALRAGFEDYGATLPHDLPLDEAGRDAGRQIQASTQILWGDHGLAASSDILDVWRPYAPELSGQAVADCGHLLPEEQPERLAALMLPHLTTS